LTGKKAEALLLANDAKVFNPDEHALSSGAASRLICHIFVRVACSLCIVPHPLPRLTVGDLKEQTHTRPGLT